MSMPNSKAYTERLSAVLSATEAKLNDIKTTCGNFGFKNAAGKFNKSNVLKDLNEIRGLGIPEEEEIPSLGTVKGYSAVAALPLKGHTKNGVKYVDPNNPEVVHTANISNTLKTDRADGNVDINRWTTRNIFKFKDEYYGYDRCVYKIPLADLANGIVIDGGEDDPHANTLANYPYPEEIVMISQKSERNFVHFINVQYSDGHYGHYNGRNYNLMIVRDRIRYGVLNDAGDGFKNFTSVYANDVNTELAYIADGYLYLPVPDAVYGEEMLDSLWDCRVVWRSDAPNRNVSIDLSLEENASNLNFKEYNFNIAPDLYWHSMCYGKDKFVLVGAYNSNSAYSYDGITWTESTVGAKKSIYSVCYGKDKFVAVDRSSNNIISYSSDGITWTDVVVSIGVNNATWNSVCYGQDKFVVVGNNDKFAYSYDGITWTMGNVSNQTYYNWDYLCYGNNKFIASGYWSSYTTSGSPSTAYSTDGITWTLLMDNQYYGRKCYGKDKFVTTSLRYSYDGIEWKDGIIEATIDNLTVRSWSNICYGNGIYIVLANNDNVFAYSYDGITWKEDTINITGGPWNALCYNDGKFVAVDRDGIYNIIFNTTNTPDSLMNFYDFDISNDRIHSFGKSYDLINKNRNKISNFNAGANDKKSIFSSFIMTNKGEILIAPNFIDRYKTFEPDTGKLEFKEVSISNTTSTWNDMCYGNGKYIAVGGGAAFAYSTDGITWTDVNSGIAGMYISVCYGNGMFLAGSLMSGQNSLIYSTDGITWTSCNQFGPAKPVVCYGNGVFIAGYGMAPSDGSSGGAYFCYSTDCITWTSANFSSARNWSTGAVYGKDKFVLAANASDTFAYSIDGTAWTEVKVSSEARNWSSVCYGNDMYIAVARDTNIFTYSYDGIVWKESKIGNTANRGWSAICFGNGVFIANAVDVSTNGTTTTTTTTNICAYSFDGITWTECTNDTVTAFGALTFGDDKFIALRTSGSGIVYSTSIPAYIPCTSPNQFFQITDNYQVGFYYYDVSNRGNTTAIADYTNRTSQLYFNLFTNTLAPVMESDVEDNYPCAFYNPSFANTGKIIKVFAESANKVTGISSFLVFTQTGVYRFIFTLSGNTLANTSIEELLTYSNTPYFVSRISKEEFWVYNDTTINSINVVAKSNTTISSDSGRVLLGRTCGGNISGHDIYPIAYIDNQMPVDIGEQGVNPFETNNMIGKYGYFKNNDGANVLCKLVENYSFDVELDPIFRVISFALNDSLYTAENGITWRNWFASDDNTTGKTEADVRSISANGAAVDLSDVIVDGMVYEVEFVELVTVKIQYTGTQTSAGLSKVTINGQEYSGSLVDFSASSSVNGLVLDELVVESGTVVECVNAGNTSNNYSINGTSMDTYKGAVHSYNITSDILIRMTDLYTPAISMGTSSMPEISMSNIMINEIGVLPSNYIAVEYLESTGTQYIDTAFKPTPNTAIEMDFQMTSTADQQRLFANYSAGSEDSGEFVTEVYTTDGTYKFCYQNGKPNWIATGISVDTNRHKIKLDGYNKTFTFDESYSANLAGYTATNNATRNLYLLWTAHTDQDNHIKASARIYSCKIWDNGTLVRDLVPVALSSGTAYLYDVINHVAYSNKGSDAFIVEYKEKIVTSIKVTTPPTKTQYQIGDIFDPTGMVVTATYSDNTTAVVDNYTIANGGQITAPILSSVSPTVSIGYAENGVSVGTSYKVPQLLCDVTILGMNSSANDAYVEINGTQYIGNGLSPVTTLTVPRGTVAKCYVRRIGIFSSGSSVITVNDVTVADNPDTIYEHPINKDTSFYLMSTTSSGYTAISCNITEESTLKALQSIAVTTPPAKTQYAEGDAFDPTGMAVTATFDDGTTYNVTPYINITNDDNLSEAIGSVTISYTVGGVTATTEYEVEFGVSFTITLEVPESSRTNNYAYASVDGVDYYTAETLTVMEGSTIRLCIGREDAKYGSGGIMIVDTVGGSALVQKNYADMTSTGSGNFKYYDYIVDGNARITLTTSEYKESSGYDKIESDYGTIVVYKQ